MATGGLELHDLRSSMEVPNLFSGEDDLDCDCEDIEPIDTYVKVFSLCLTSAS